LSFQDFFKLYARLAGASGTLQDVDHELFFNYRVYTLRIPPRVRSRMRIDSVMMFGDRLAKRDAVVARVDALHAQGRAVLIGTRNVADSEFLAEALTRQGFDYQLLNAKQPALEAEIVAAAGESGKITVATNMAGRGTDIKLSPSAAAAGGLCVIMFEPHESIRVDWQLYGRTARQGQPGEVFRYVSLEDELITRNLPRPVRWFARITPERVIRLAQRLAERRSFALRKRINQATRESQKRMTFTDHG
jgi:preprotein translocase subunit SecA